MEKKQDQWEEGRKVFNYLMNVLTWVVGSVDPPKQFSKPMWGYFWGRVTLKTQVRI